MGKRSSCENRKVDEARVLFPGMLLYFPFIPNRLAPVTSPVQGEMETALQSKRATVNVVLSLLCTNPHQYNEDY